MPDSDTTPDAVYGQTLGKYTLTVNALGYHPESLFVQCIITTTSPNSFDKLICLKVAPNSFLIMHVMVVKGF